MVLPPQDKTLGADSGYELCRMLRCVWVGKHRFQAERLFDLARRAIVLRSKLKSLV